MPVYDFVCRECDDKFQITCHVDEYKPKTFKCPKCGSAKLDRIWSSVHVETSKKS